jgi:hypothetical protein
MLFVLLLLAYLGSITLIEYFSYFNPKIKLIIVVISLIMTFFIAVYFVLIPFVKLLGLGKLLTFYDVSALLNKRYPEIKDRLINILELSEDDDSNYSNELVKASIHQKIEELKIFSFTDAIRYKDLKPVFFVFTAIILFITLGFVSFPDVFRDSSVRLIRYQQQFEKPAPYTFNLLTKNLEVVMGESLELIVSCEGKQVPPTLYVNVGGTDFLMTRENEVFKYTLENVNSSFSIYFTDKKYYSKDYIVKVINKPFIAEFSVSLQPPSYTGLNTENLHNIGDLKIASGTSVTWHIKTVDTDSLDIILNDSVSIKGELTEQGFEVKKTFYSNTDYRISVKNSRLKEDNSLVYKIQIIPDLFPEIKVVQVRDSLDFKTFHFKGNIADDYGFHQLVFNISVNGKDSMINLPFTPAFLNQDFYYSFDFESVKNMGKSFKYYFSVYDNDFTSHFKRSISETFTFTFPDYQDIVSKENEDMNAMDHLMDKSAKLTREIQQEFENFKRNQINSNMSDWEKFQRVKDIVNKKNELENVLEQISQQNKDANNFLNSFSEEKQELIKKQEQINQLLNEVLTDDLKKLFEEFNELAKQFDSRKFDQLSKEMNLELDDLSKQLDKNMQLLKKMKVEQKVERVVDELNKLVQLEENIQNHIKEKGSFNEAGEEEKQNAGRFDELEKDYKEATDFNKDLEKPMNLLDMDKEFKTIQQNFQQNIENIDRKNKKKASDGVGENAKKIKEMAFAMDQMMKNNKKKENEVNIEVLKQILDNLILVSFDQEKLLGRLKNIDYNNPLVNEIKIKQHDMQTQVEFVKDSLYALSKRTPEISSVINKELLALQTNVDFSFENLETGNIGGARMYQQYGITAANNLALFLSEALDNIKEQQNGDGDGDSDNKSNKKGTKPSIGKLKQSQQSIKEQLQKMIEEMKNGNKGQLSKSIGQTIAQQEMMQQLIREMLNGGNVGKQAEGQLKAVEQLLEQSRRDLINKNINSELINRQNLILSKLLDAEKSGIERDVDDKRESKTAVDVKKSNPEGYFEYKSKNTIENEMLKRNSNQLRSFYDQKYNSFLNQIKN